MKTANALGYRRTLLRWSSRDSCSRSVDSGHGNPAAGEAMVQWTSPGTGTIQVSGRAWYAHAPLDRRNDNFLKLGSTGSPAGQYVWSAQAMWRNWTRGSVRVNRSTGGFCFEIGRLPSTKQPQAPVVPFDLQVLETATVPSMGDPYARDGYPSHARPRAKRCRAVENGPRRRSVPTGQVAPGPSAMS